MSTGGFDIIGYLSGLTGFCFDKAVLRTIATRRGVLDAYDIDDLDSQTQDLLLADLLFVACVASPNSSASYAVTDGSFKTSVGSQTLNDTRAMRQFVYDVYNLYGDPRAELVLNSTGQMAWVDENEFGV